LSFFEYLYFLQFFLIQTILTSFPRDNLSWTNYYVKLLSS